MQHIPIDREGDTRDWVAMRELEVIINGKQQVELTMAKKLLARFSSGDALFIGALRALVSNAVDDIWEIILTKGPQPYVDAFNKDAVNYGFVKKMGLKKGNWASFLLFLIEENNQGTKTNVWNLDAVQCADMIRFFGEVIENGTEACKNTPDEAFFKALENRMKAYQKTKGRFGFWSKAGLVKPKPGAQRLRDSRSKEAIKVFDPDLKKKRQETADETKRRLASISRFEAQMSQVERRLAEMGGGIKRWLHLDTDPLAKMDKVFGLSHGATISGTTTDTLFFLNKLSYVDLWLGKETPGVHIPDYVKCYYEGWDWAHYKKTGRKVVFFEHSNGEVTMTPFVKARPHRHFITGLDPMYYMVPLGTIVGQGHHTTLEVALPLALNKKINYVIGDYESLMPRRGSMRAKSDVSGVSAILNAAKNDDRNKYILVYHNDRCHRAGYISFDKKKDAQLWGKIARADVNLMRNFKKFKPYPTKKDVAAMDPAIEQLLKGDGASKTGTGGRGVKATKEELRKRGLKT